MRLAFVLILVLGQKVAHAQSSGLEGKLQHFLDSVRNRNGFPGMCLSYVLPDGVPHHLATGYSDAEGRVAMKPNALLLSGSAPKMFYATVVVMLEKEGKLNLDDHVIKYLGKYPWYKRIPNASNITIRQLLQHRSGIMEYYELGDFMQRLKREPDKEWKPEEILAYVFDKDALFEAGNGFGYSDTNYFVAGLVIQEVTGQSVYDVVRERIIGPLGMTSTIPSVSRQIPNLVPGYFLPNSPFGLSGKSIINGKFVINPQFEWCGGGYASSTGDWAKFIIGLMKGKLLDEPMRKQMTSGLPCNLGPGEEYGLGLQIRKTPLGKSYGHGGWFPGYLTEVEYFPEKDMVVVIQYNTDDFSKIKGHPHQQLVKLASLVSVEQFK